MGGSGSGSRFGSRYGVADRCTRLAIGDLVSAGGLKPAAVAFDYTVDAEREVKRRVGILWTPAGTGRRPWFACPECGRRCAVLYLPASSARPALFACRLCLRLRYACQRETRSNRLARKSRKLFLRAGSRSLGAEFTLKPKGMHWSTFNRLMDAAEAAHLESCDVSLNRLRRALSSIKRRR